MKKENVTVGSTISMSISLLIMIVYDPLFMVHGLHKLKVYFQSLEKTRLILYSSYIKILHA